MCEPIVVVEVVLNDPMAVRVAEELSVIAWRDDLVAAGVLALLALGSEEDVIVIHFLAHRTDIRIVVPLLHKEDAGFSSSVGLKGVLIEADDCEDAAALGDELPNPLVAAVVETTLREDDGHASAGAEEVEIALDEEQVAPDGAF